MLLTDYVHGRRVKLMIVRDDDGREYMWTPWQGHSDEALRTLCERAGIDGPGN